MMLSVFALVVSATANLAHAHISASDMQTHVSSDIDTVPDNADNACCGCSMHCHHHHMPAASFIDHAVSLSGRDIHFTGHDNLKLSEFIDGLKRPPRA